MGPSSQLANFIDKMARDRAFCYTELKLTYLETTPLIAYKDSG